MATCCNQNGLLGHEVEVGEDDGTMATLMESIPANIDYRSLTWHEFNWYFFPAPLP
jgi:hypothetical protein